MKIVAALCLALSLSGAHAADAGRIPANAEVKLVDGANDVTLAGMTVRVVKGYVGTLTAHSYDTFTSYVLPEKPGGTWLQIPVDQPDSSDSEFRTVESADSTVQAIVMYRSGGALYAVQATKTGADAPDLYVKPAPVNFKVYRFNGNLDVARFKLTQTSRSKATYMNAGDALTKEFFSR
ncbi:hypothetical protein [Burkholderia vietnamiensis]|uniref:hypothetical protein n=2 Tax=Burkholderia vietnamiensis TaxID=60552 RepID=UPI000758FA5C|nr:hypothetical protein [Burkholderia vietnamiensis]TPQ47442.1 hypothetical protein C2U71_04500 [Burkholderia ubonensis]AOJ16958.1 hypothetical protein WJ02_25050 [Burkholderia vietnamiensis]KVE33093.1 hypothetical protein WI93_24785 [Burkholderia vietnamiensis]KVE64911.1 hypothetical protein WI97_17435 [Burkholderia vietnamiensis]KVF03052.1 hypothetical protein WJ03_02990 [Burkholderia vietnamiensis]